jgi:hypothetical protein
MIFFMRSSSKSNPASVLGCAGAARGGGGARKILVTAACAQRRARKTSNCGALPEFCGDALTDNPQSASSDRLTLPRSRAGVLAKRW